MKGLCMHRGWENLLILRWMGEKYDGIRCCWIPDRDLMYPS